MVIIIPSMEHCWCSINDSYHQIRGYVHRQLAKDLECDMYHKIPEEENSHLLVRLMEGFFRAKHLNSTLEKS